MRRLIITVVTVVTVVGTVAIAGAAYGGSPFRDATFVAELSGEEEVPPVATDASGEAKFEVDGDVLLFELEIQDAVDLLGAAGAHIHCAPAGENGPVVAFLAGVVPGGFDGTIGVKASLTDDNIVNSACGGTIGELVASMSAGGTYVNVHSPEHPGGEIRGQIRAR